MVLTIQAPFGAGPLSPQCSSASSASLLLKPPTFLQEEKRQPQHCIANARHQGVEPVCTGVKGEKEEKTPNLLELSLAAS